MANEFDLEGHPEAPKLLQSPHPLLVSLLELRSASELIRNSTFTPLVFSGIFYASNGQYPVSYVDSLYNCVSAMTVCGLATVDLSSLTGWQQVILFIQMCLGSPVSRKACLLSFSHCPQRWWFRGLWFTCESACILEFSSSC